MNRRLILSAFLVLCLSTGLLAQGKLGVYAAAFYNLENLWDTEDNPDNPGDDDFTPGGKYEWTQVKYEQKLQNVAKVISQLARDYCPAGPAIIGISEVENKKVTGAVGFSVNEDIFYDIDAKADRKSTRLNSSH